MKPAPQTSGLDRDRFKSEKTTDTDCLTNLLALAIEIADFGVNSVECYKSKTRRRGLQKPWIYRVREGGLRLDRREFIRQPQHETSGVSELLSVNPLLDTQRSSHSQITSKLL